MKKFFLIPLMTLVCSVMAWGTTRTAGNYQQLQEALEAAVNGDVIELTANIEPTGLINITKSITLDGGANKYGILKSTGTCQPYMPETGTAPSGTSYGTVIAVNYQGNVTAGLNVTIKNFTMNVQASANSVPNLKYGIIAFDGVAQLNIENSDISVAAKNAITVTGKEVTPVSLNISNTNVITGTNSGYPVYILKPTNLMTSDCYMKGFCGLYFKGRADGTFGTYGYVAGSRGTIANCSNCTFESFNNSHGTTDNDFGIFAFEDDGINLTLNNCKMNSEELGDEWQSVIYMKNDYSPGIATHKNRTEAQPVTVTITGANSTINGRMVARASNPGNPNAAQRLATAGYRTQLNFIITGGTYAQNVGPDGITYPYILDNTTNGTFLEQHITIPAGYVVQEVTESNVTLYRVVPDINISYDINQSYEEKAEGENPNTAFIVQETTALVNNATEANYVQVREDSGNAATLTIGKADADQTLTVTNGMDVQDNAKVIVKSGSALVVENGGVITAKPENIVIEANENGAASLLLSPAVTVNQTPNLTVKMVAKNVGKIGSDYYWHRFALPIDQVNAEDGSWAKDGHSYGTLLYKWDYENNEWASLTNVNQMQPFYGYTMTITQEVAGPGDLIDAGYIFKGKLTGNVNSVLNFSRQGYNFFGNSYTGYISILQLIDELIGNDNLDGTVWMWNPNRQQYEGIALNDLRDHPTAARYNNQNSWKKEVAPMQTFILRLMTTDTDTKANIDYATAVWGNPRYEDITGVTPAPARRVQRTEDAYVRIVVSAANGKADAINFQEDANLSDANDRGYDAAKYMNERTINVYSTIDGENFGTIATDNLEGKKLTINTIDEIAYTISFEDVEGNAYALRDNVTGAIFAIEEGATYEFTAQPNSIVEGRFEIVAIANVPTAIENTEVKANVKGIYTIMGQYLGEDFDILPAGVYVVNGVKIVK